MGEYWKPVNIDKRQQVHPHRVGDGLKWQEWVSEVKHEPHTEPFEDSNTRLTVARLIREGIWSDQDEIRIVSDYGGDVHWLGPQTARVATYDDKWADAHALSARDPS